MANDRLFRALDQLAGVASEEIEKARAFKIQQAQRMEAIQREKEMFDRQIAVKEELNRIREAELDETIRVNTEKISGETAVLRGAAAKAQQELTDLKAQHQREKSLNNIRNGFLALSEDMTARAIEAYDKGAPEELVDELVSRSRTFARRAGIETPTTDIDFSQKPRADKLTPFERSRQTALGADAAKREIQFGKIAPMLEQVRTEFLALDPAKTGAGAKLEQIAKSWAAEFGLDPATKAYKDVVQAMAVQTSRALGDVGNIAVAERKINEKLLPKATDTREEGLKKIQLFSSLIEAIRTSNQGLIRDLLKQSGIKGREQNAQLQSPPGFMESFSDTATTVAPTFDVGGYLDNLNLP